MPKITKRVSRRSQKSAEARGARAGRIEANLRLRVISLGLNRHDVPRQAGHAFLDPVPIDLEGAVPADFERALIEQVVQLNGDALPVCFGDAEPD